MLASHLNTWLIDRSFPINKQFAVPQKLPALTGSGQMPKSAVRPQAECPVDFGLRSPFVTVIQFCCPTFYILKAVRQDGAMSQPSLLARAPHWSTIIDKEAVSPSYPIYLIESIQYCDFAE